MIRPETAAPAIQRGLDFLQRRQLPRGEFKTLAGPDPNLPADTSAYDPSLFTTMHVATSLLRVGSPEARAMAQRAGDFLLTQMLPGGLWRFWSDDHPGSIGMPADIDDTACITHLLHSLGFKVPHNSRLLRANRDPKGFFYTWILPRSQHFKQFQGLRLAWRTFQARRPTAAFFSLGPEPPSRRGVDAVVNANALLVCRDPRDTPAIVDWLERLVREGRAATADQFYQSELSLFYALIRGAEAGVDSLRPLLPLLRAALEKSKPTTFVALEAAQALCVACAVGAPTEFASQLASILLDAQQADGSWPARVHSYDGYSRSRAWGSAELTTGFCLEALARFHI